MSNVHEIQTVHDVLKNFPGIVLGRKGRKVLVPWVNRLAEFEHRLTMRVSEDCND